MSDQPPREPNDYADCIPGPHDALTGGAWRFDPFKRIQVWVPGVEVERPAYFNVIACHTCKATATESCRNPGGDKVKAHVARSLPRYCPDCGRVELGYARRLCDTCRDQNAAAAKHAAELKRLAEQRGEVAA